jgi:exodeoxyribonuclease-3
MKIATWNVNSVRTRLPNLLTWLERRNPDVVCLQETKVPDDEFPMLEMRARGYHCLLSGQRTYNGVAILSRREASDCALCFPDDTPDSPRRILVGTIDGIRIINVYAPNGGEVGSDKYQYKLEWYKRLRSFLDAEFDARSDVLICGDFNVAPEDRDVWDTRIWRGRIMFSDPEKEALRDITDWGFKDALRLHRSEGGLYTWWDYRAGRFRRNWGLRIDHVFVTESLARRCANVEIDRDERNADKPSDHAPVVATFDPAS